MIQCHYIFWKSCIKQVKKLLLFNKYKVTLKYGTSNH
uniref:Uncharacterized protein n=1 Tax=Rhizophora mucronata TaxID=61149 RepID=A0A2P2PSE8_RHIMU